MEKNIQGGSGKKQKLPSGIFWLKGLAILLSMMLIFTIISRIAASFTVPEVSIEQPSNGKISHTVTAEGTVEAKGETAVVTQEGILISQVNVHAGEHVEEGALLFTLNMDSLDGQILELESQIKKLQLENESLEKNQAENNQKQQLDLKRAQEDYADTVSKNQAAQEKAAQELKALEEAKNQAEKAVGDADAAKNTAEAEYNQEKEQFSQKEAELKDAKRIAQDAEKQLENAKYALQTAEEAGEDTELFEREVQEKQSLYDTANADMDEKQSAYEEEQNRLNEKQTAYDNAVELKNEKQSVYENSSTQWKEKQDAAEEQVQSQQEALKAALRALEDANRSSDTDNSRQINEISVQQYEKQLKKLKQLKEQNGEIRTATAGIITKVYAQVGQKTTDTAAVVVSDEESGLIYTAIVDGKNLSYLAVSDEADISATGKKAQGCSISSIETLEGGKSVRVTIALTGEDFSPGESADMSVTRKSEPFDFVIPVTAIYEENNKAYIYILDTENTILGEQYIARKAEVEILDKNSSYAAVSSSLLTGDSQVITDCDRNVGAGDIVRLAE